MKRYLCLVLCLLLPVCAAAVEMDAPITGVVCYPTGSDETTATYVYRYSFPHVSGESNVAQMINEVYAYEVEYIENFTVTVDGEMYGVGSSQYYTDMTAEVTACSDDYLSIRLNYDRLTCDGVSTRIAAHVFSLQGAKAGTVTSLPYILGVLQADENDEWLLNRQTLKCDRCVRSMVWEQLQDLADEGRLQLYDDVDEEYFEGIFYPEEDFYLAADGSFVFFLQEDTVCPPEYGVLTFSLTMEDILDEL